MTMGKGVREVFIWLAFGVVLGAGMGVLIKLYQLWIQGKLNQFPLSLASDLDLVAATLAAGALSQQVVRRGLRGESNWDLALFVFSLIVVIGALVVFSSPPASSFTWAPHTHIVILAAAVLTGCACVYGSVP